jgi:hypothetical protein
MITIIPRCNEHSSFIVAGHRSKKLFEGIGAMRILMVTVLLISLLITPGFSDEPTPDLQLLNTEVFHQSVDIPITTLRSRRLDQIEPSVIQLDVADGKYYAATLIYPKTLAFSDARRAINRVYKKYEHEKFSDNPQMGLWRVEDSKFAIQLTEHEDGEHLQVIYVTFQPPEVVKRNAVKAILKTLEKEGEHR